MPVLGEAEALERVAEARALGLRIGFTCGVFDLLHEGHAGYLEAARGLCDLLIVAVNDDASARAVKGPGLPLRDFVGRSKLVAALRAVDLVVAMPDARPTRLIRLLRPDLYVKGGDYRVEDLRSAPEVEGWGGEVRVLDVGANVSSSELRRRLLDRAAAERRDERLGGRG